MSIVYAQILEESRSYGTMGPSPLQVYTHLFICVNLVIHCEIRPACQKANI